MPYLNITLVGRIGDEPELRYTPNGVAVTNFSLAVNRKWKDSKGNDNEQVIWFKVTCWQRTAEVVVEYLGKGQEVMVVSDQIEAEAYLSKQGDPRSSIVVTAKDVIFLSGGGGNGGNSGNGGGTTKERRQGSSGGGGKSGGLRPRPKI